MKPNNAELFQQLREITKDLIFSSESDDKFEPFIWETENTLNLKQNLSELILEVEFTVIECLAFYRKKQAIVETGSIKQELL